MEMKDLKRCGGCQFVTYCSRECQKADWKQVHKAACAVNAKAHREYRESPRVKSEAAKRITRWIQAWNPTIAFCSPLALDLANHEWGRHETHSLVMYMEHTDRNEDCQTFTVRKAIIQETATVLATIPPMEDVSVTPPNGEWARFRCFLFFKEQKGFASPNLVETMTWNLPNPRELWYGLDKEYSRAVAIRAIPQLLIEINEVRKPQQAEEKFKSMVV